MGKKKIVLDTNILISACGWEGKPKELFRKILNREYELIISREQIDEVKRVLNYPKFDFTEDQKSRFLVILVLISTIIQISKRLDIIKNDPEDNRILEIALESQADFIISGDAHLLELKSYETIQLITVSDFLSLEQKQF